MRLVWILLLVALLPQRIAWNGGGDACCGDTCECAAEQVSSCCAAKEGPVIVALCGCGDSHRPGLVERAPFDWFFTGPVGFLETLLPHWTAPSRDRIPAGISTAPEPPPPRSDERAR